MTLGGDSTPLEASEIDVASIVQSATEHLSFDGSGNVSIPNGDLDLKQNRIVGADRLSGPDLTIYTNLGSVVAYNATTSGADHRFRDSNATNLMYLREGGNVEIPNGVLQLTGRGQMEIWGNSTDGNPQFDFFDSDKTSTRRAALYYDLNNEFLAMRDWVNSQNILTASIGGNVEIPNGDLTDGTNVIYDQSASEIPDSAMGSIANSTLTNSSVTVTAGNALTGGGTVSLGGSTTIDVDESAINAGQVDGYDVQKNGTDGTGVINFKT